MSDCPKCGKRVTHVNLSDISVNGGIGKGSWVGIGYTCPTCNVLLSVGIDPVALKTDTVNDVLNGLKKMLGRG